MFLGRVTGHVVASQKDKVLSGQKLLVVEPLNVKYDDATNTPAALGTVLASLAHGVPLVCLPMGRAQHDNAARVAALGAGVILDAGASEEEIADAIGEVRGTPGYRSAAEGLAQEMARDDGTGAASSLLRSLG